jgi:hypothetical protein
MGETGLSGYIDYLLPIAIMLAAVVHIIKTGRNFIWVYVVIFIPLFGALAYFAVEIIPSFFKSRTAQKLGANAKAIADPNKSFREAQRAAEITGSVDSKRALAEEYARRGKYSEAIEIYRDAAVGQFADDPALLMGLARAQFASGDGAAAQASLDRLQAADPNFVSGDGHLLYARALEMQGKDEDAITEYARLVPYYSGEEARARYAMLLQKNGRDAEAQPVYAEILKRLDGAPKRIQAMQKEWGDIARKNLRR